VADIEYVIGAKDNATAPMKKVEGGLDRLSATTKKTADAAEKSLKRIDVSFASLLKGAGILKAVDLAVQGAQRAFGAIIGSISSANAAYDTQVEAVKGLETALRLNGENVEQQSAKMQAFANDMQALTGVGDEATLALAKQAAIMGVGADQLGDVTKATIGLSEATGKSLQESLKLVKNSLEGEFGAFGEIIPAIKQATTAQEKLAMVQDLASKGLEAKIDASNRLAGVEERAAGAVGDLMEQFGALLAPVREVIAIGIKAFAEALTGILVPAVQYVQALFEKWKPAIIGAVEATINAVIFGITAAEVAYNNFGTIVGMAIDSILLSYETYRADTMQLFTVTIPAYATWFGENFFNIIETAFSAVSAVITNHITKIIDTLSALWEFIASGGSSDILGQLGEIAGRSYLEGFENSIGELPNIAGRALTDREKELQSSIGAAATKVADEFNTKFAARAVSLGGTFGEGIESGIDLALGGGIGAKSSASSSSSSDSKLQAFQGRLLTRGPGDRRKDQAALLEDLISETKSIKTASMESASELADIKNQLANNPALQIVGVP
jgi:hypothetical protein